MSQKPTGGPRPSRNALVCLEAERAFQQSFNEFIQSLLDVEHAKFIDGHNRYKLTHGDSWRYPALEGGPASSFEEASSVTFVPVADILRGDVGVIDRLARQIVDDLSGQFARLMINVMNDATEATGNVVKQSSNSSFADAFLESLKKIQFSVGPDGIVQLPQILVPPGLAVDLSEQLERASPELQAEIERVKAQKIQEAYDSEAARKSRFKQGSTK